MNVVTAMVGNGGVGGCVCVSGCLGVEIVIIERERKETVVEICHLYNN